MQERIVAAAIRIRVPEEFDEFIWNDAKVYTKYLTISAPPPARHHTLLQPMAELCSQRILTEDQGFLTSTGRYVSREEAYEIVIAAKQKLIDHCSRIDGKLFSEDLW